MIDLRRVNYIIAFGLEIAPVMTMTRMMLEEEDSLEAIVDWRASGSPTPPEV
jgi:hypothetical protein